jgi:hypothetical protein
MTDISSVIGWKHDHQAGMCTQEGVITEFPGGIPSAEDQATWTTEYEAHVAANAYKGKRQIEYPTIADQLDDLYHNGVDGWRATIKVTKDKYPK